MQHNLSNKYQQEKYSNIFFLINTTVNDWKDTGLTANSYINNKTVICIIH